MSRKEARHVWSFTGKTLLAAWCPAVRVVGVRYKVVFIKINNVLTAVVLYLMAQVTQITYSAAKITYPLAGCFLTTPRCRSAIQIAFI
jgi:hypothetical protein